MSGSIRAKVKNGFLEPLEKVNLPEGSEVEITIHRIPTRADIEASRRSAGAWKGKVDAESLIRHIYADRLIATRPKPEL